MTWSLYSLPSGRVEIDLRVLVPADARLISDHTTLPEARDAREAYQRRQEREARERAERERDLAVAHDRQPYPTAAAYEQVCLVLAGVVKELEEAREVIGTRSVPCSACGKETGSLGRRITAEIGMRRHVEARLAAAEECLRWYRIARLFDGVSPSGWDGTAYRQAMGRLIEMGEPAEMTEAAARAFLARGAK